MYQKRFISYQKNSEASQDTTGSRGRTITRRSLLLTGAASGLSAACSAPGSSPSPSQSATAAPGTVEFWFSVGKEREPMMVDILRAFEEKHPSYTVTWEHAPGDTQLLEKLITTTVAGTPPDVANLNGGHVPQLDAAGVLADMDALAAADRGFKLSELFETSGLALARKLASDGKLYALPRGLTLLHMFYNRDAFAQHGLKDPNELYDTKQWTWAAAVEAATKLTRRSGDAYEQYGYAADLEAIRALGPIAQNGGVFFDEAKKRFVFADDSASVEAIQWVVDLKDRHAVAQPYPAPDGEPTNIQTLFTSGKAAMFHGFNAYLASMAPRIGSSFRYAVAPMPVGKKEALYGNSGGGFGVFKGGKRPDLGWQFAKHGSGTESYLTAIRHSNIQVPLLTDKRAKEAFLSSGVYGIDRVLKHSPTAITETFNVPNLGDIRTAFNRQTTAIWRSESAVRPALQTAQRDMQPLYDQNAQK